MEQAWRLALEATLAGWGVSPRGLPTREVGEPVSIALASARHAVVSSPARRLNQAYAAAEFCWIMAGRDDVKTLRFFNEAIAAFADQDGGQRFFGAYGPPLISQLSHVEETLRRDHQSRQAVVTLWRPSPPPTLDVPCTIALHFMARDGALSLVTYMRSNDVWLGLPYDSQTFCHILAWVAARLDFAVGGYHHVVGSLHLYERDAAAAQAILESPQAPGELIDVEFDTTFLPACAWEWFEAMPRGVAPPEHALRLGGWGPLLSTAWRFAERKLMRPIHVP